MKKTTRERVVTASDNFRRVSRAHWNAKGAERRALSRELDRSTDELNAAQAAAREEFAKARGWRLHRKVQDVTDLLKERPSRFGKYRGYPEMDHPDGFVGPSGKPVGLVTHSYASWEEIQQYADASGVRVARLDWSWYNPEGCIAAMFTLPSKQTGASHETDSATSGILKN